jgi:alpha-L-fucosidase
MLGIDPARRRAIPREKGILMRMRLVLMSAVLLMSLTCTAPAQIAGGGGDAHPALKSNAASLGKWQEMRFGMFIHWGPVTLRGTEIGWSRGPQVPIDEYDALYREFNPVLFNAAEWIGAAKAAGMKYLVIVSKHHDGFCLWDTKYTDYRITSGPFHRDVLRELSDECARQGIMFCTYYSILDWHHPEYTTRYGGDSRPVLESGMDRYRSYLKNQIRELVKEYHSNLLWFDGQWEKSWTHRDGMDLYAYARGLNDALLINNRVDKGRRGPPQPADSESYAGDFGTPEQEIGALDNRHPWESCITIGTQWAWRPNDSLKTLMECIHILAKTAGGGGNLLLNISPMPDGRFEQRQIDRLKGIGKWLERFGESIYGTCGGPYRSASWLASTCRGNRIYLHLLAPPNEQVRLPAIPGRIVRSARILGGGPLSPRVEEGSLVMPLPSAPLDGNDAVIVLELDGSAETLGPMDVPAGTSPDLRNK